MQKEKEVLNNGSKFYFTPSAKPATALAFYFQHNVNSFKLIALLIDNNIHKNIYYYNSTKAIITFSNIL